MRKELQREPAQDMIKCAVRELEMFCIHRVRLDMFQAAFLDLRINLLHHALGKIDAQHTAAWPSLFSSGPEHRAAAASHIQNFCADWDAGHIHEPFTED